MNIGRLNAKLELKEATEAGYFEGYAAVYGNIDNGNDVIVNGAFTKMRLTRNGKMRIAAYHDMSKIIGLADIVSDEKGILVKGQINTKIGYARDTYELMKIGAIDSMSVGYLTLDADYKEDIRIIKEAELWEVSVLPFGMNEQAGIIDVKSDKQQFETALQMRMGLSQKEAKQVTSLFFADRDGQTKGTETVLDLSKAETILNKYI